MPSTNPTLQYLTTTNNNTHRKDKIYDATVVANYGDPGLQEDYFADILSFIMWFNSPRSIKSLD